MNFAIIDLQGFKRAHSIFVPKEICVYTANEYSHFVIKSPHPFSCLKVEEKRQAAWLSRNYHGLRWDEGHLELDDTARKIAALLANKIIIVKGAEKIRWVHEITNNFNLHCINIESYGCELKFNTKTSDEPCYVHKQKEKVKTLYHCAFRNVINLKNWIYTNNNKLISFLI